MFGCVGVYAGVCRVCMYGVGCVGVRGGGVCLGKNFKEQAFPIYHINL